MDLLCFEFKLLRYLSACSEKAGRERQALLPADWIKQCENLSRYFSSGLLRNLAQKLKALSPTDLQDLINQSAERALFEQAQDCCFAYEDLHAAAQSKKTGVFYTPVAVVDRIVAETLDPILEHKAEPVILDPACGAGIFLLRTLKYILRLKSTKDSTLKLAAENLCGVDCDSYAVELTKILLALTALEGLPSWPAALPLFNNLRCGNSLLRKTDVGLVARPNLQPFQWEEEFREVFKAQGFDCVIGNPPYGLSRGEQIAPEEKTELIRVYAPYRSGKPNKFLLFLARSYELLRPGGRLGFIVPNSWLGVKDGLALRRYFLREQAFSKILVFEKQVFPKAGVETIIVVLAKGLRQDQFFIERVPAAHRQPAKTSILSHKNCLEQADSIIPTTWSSEVEALVHLIRKNSFPLDSPQSAFKALIAMQAYREGQGRPPQTTADVKGHVYHSKSKAGDDYFPYLEGKDVKRYQLNWSGQYLKHGSWLAEPQSLERFSGPRILIREILGPKPYLCLAAYAEETLLYNKSVLHVVFKQHPCNGREPGRMRALLAILNSTMGSFVLRYLGRKSARKLFPKLVNADLKAFPLPLNFDKDSEKLANLCLEMEKSIKNNVAKELLAALQVEIDKCVCAVYGIDAASVAALASA